MTLNWILSLLLIIGGINLGLVGLFDYDLITSVFGSGVFTQIIFVLVGASALWRLYEITIMKK